MKHDDLPTRWQAILSEWITKRHGNARERLGADDFPGNQVVRIKLPDDSFSEFRYAFYIEAPEINEIGVFTEHCGYHVFPYFDTVAEVLNPS